MVSVDHTVFSPDSDLKTSTWILKDKFGAMIISEAVMIGLRS